MFDAIVLALDGSEGSQNAVPVATELARQDGARIVIAHVEQGTAGKGGGPIIATEDEIQSRIHKQAEELSADVTSRWARSRRAGRPRAGARGRRFRAPL